MFLVFLIQSAQVLYSLLWSNPVVLVTMVNNYTNAEITDMHITYCLADGNIQEAHHIYKEQFPSQRIPQRIPQHLRWLSICIELNRPREAAISDNP
jgi:hypothetical protein